jgi:glutathione S-transferase
MKPKLISFKLCPYVQKAVLALLHKGIEFDIEYIDLMNPPDWFNEISPLGKVPVVQVGDQIIFESSVIVEYLDEAYGEPLHPADLVLKAQNRSWMEFGNECLMNGFNLIMTPDEAGFNEQLESMLSKLDRIENQLSNSKFFNGDSISLVDLSFAPLFQRLSFLEPYIPQLKDSSRHPKVTQWAENLMQLPIMPESAVPELEQLYEGMMKGRGGHIKSLMAA